MKQERCPSPSSEGESFFETESVGVVTSIDEVKSGKGMKYRLVINEVPFCTLKRRELKASGLKVGEAVTQQKLSELIHGPLYQRGRAYALHLLDSRPMTAEQIRKKLTEHSYPSEASELIIEDLISSGILNDKEYATSYLLTYLGRESERRIRMKLMTKGVSKTVIDEAFSSYKELMQDPMDDTAVEDGDENSVIRKGEAEALQKAFIRYSKNTDFSDRSSRDSLIRKLLYRGFQYSDILFLIEKRDENY